MAYRWRCHGAVEVHSWAHFSELMGEVSADVSTTWLFRGITNNERKLVPKIGRSDSRKDPETGESLAHSEQEERKALAQFQRTAPPFLAYQPKTALEWLAVAQHHGMQTRLLDWTESPLVAAYFAMEKAGTEGAPGIYVL